MRYLSLIIILAIVSLTWHFSQLEAKVPVGVHHEIQMDLAKIITAAIQTQLPSAQKIDFKRLFSETKSADEVHVFFEYSFDDSKNSQSVSTGISGVAVVKRNTQEAGTWVLESVRLSESSLEFKDGIVVTREGVADESKNNSN